MFDNTDDLLDDLFGGGGKGPASLREQNVNDVIGGIIFKVERLEERNDDGTVKMNERGKPKPLFVSWVITDLRDPSNPEDDGARRIWWKGNALYELQQFVREHGTGSPRPGGSIFRKLIGTKPTGKMQPMKLHAANYTLPTLENERLAYEYAQRWNSKSAPKDDMFGPVSAPPAAQFAQPASGSPFGSPTLDSMRSTGNAASFQGEPPF